MIEGSLSAEMENGNPVEGGQQYLDEIRENMGQTELSGEAYDKFFREREKIKGLQEFAEITEKGAPAYLAIIAAISSASGNPDLAIAFGTTAAALGAIQLARMWAGEQLKKPEPILASKISENLGDNTNE